VAEEKEIRWGMEEIKEEIESAVLVFFALVPARKMGVGVGRIKESRSFDASRWTDEILFSSTSLCLYK
jgi:hypothetical protein